MNNNKWKIEQIKKIVEDNTGRKINTKDRTRISVIAKKVFINLTKQYLKLNHLTISEYLGVDRSNIYHHLKTHDLRFDQEYKKYYLDSEKNVKSLGLIYDIPLEEQLQFHLTRASVIKTQLENQRLNRSY